MAAEGYLPIWEGDGARAIVAQPARDYLARRGVDQSLCRAAKIGACLRGQYAGRIIVPVLGRAGQEWLGWVGRTWANGAAKPYLNLPGPWRSAVLYNHAAVHEPVEDALYIVEGVFDALALWPDGVAVLGKPSIAQIEALAQAQRPVVALLDGDAWVEGWSLALRLRMMGVRAGAVRLPPRTDPDEVDRADLWEAARASLGAADAVRVAC